MTVFDPVPDEMPNPDCAHCGGEGVKTIRTMMFDFDCAPACPHCWSEDEEE